MRTRVALAKCTQYRQEDISAALEKLFSQLGGLQRFIPPGGSVLIKPNLLTDREPEKAVTTHPEVARALVRMVRKCGGHPFIGDSPAGAMKIESVLEKTGFRALCAEEKVRFAVLEKEPTVTHDFNGVSLAIAKAAFDADLVINVPKLKTHAFTLFTNAVKNVFGLLPGFQKMLLHKSFPNPRQFGECLAFLYKTVKPGLTVCDAVVGMEGDGPSGGTPVQLGFLAASADGVALDMALCNLLGINAKNVFYLDSLRRSGGGEWDPEMIELAGDHPETGKIKQPGAADAMRLIPRRLVRFIEPLVWIAPSFTEACTACGICVKSCPVKALELTPPGRPVVNRRKCIGCCCCHEVCPARAIKMSASPLLRLTSLRKMLNAT